MDVIMIKLSLDSDVCVFINGQEIVVNIQFTNVITLTTSIKVPFQSFFVQNDIVT